MINPRNFLFAISAWIIVIFAMFPYLFHRQLFFAEHDIIDIFLSVRRSFADQMMASGIPLLYKNKLMGASFIANAVHGVLYPGNVLFLVLDSVLAYKITLSVHFLLLPMGWYIAFRTLKYSDRSCMVITPLIVSCGLIWSEHQHGQILSTAWSGFAVAAWFQFLKSGRMVWAAVSGCIAGLIFLAGDPILSVGVVFIGLLQIFALMDMKLPLRRLAVGLLLNGIVLVLIALPVLHEGLAILPFSARSLGFGLRESMSYSSHWSRILEFFWPGVLPPLSSAAYPWPELRYGIGTEWWYPSLAAGPLFLVFYFLGIWRAECKWRLGILIIPIIALCYLSLGRTVWAGEFIWSTFFPLNHLRFPERLLRYAFLLGLPLLAAGGDHFWKTIDKYGGLRLLRSNLILMGVVLAFCLWNQTSFPVPALGNISNLKAPPLLAALEANTEQTRILICESVSNEYRQLPMTFDVRHWQLARLRGNDAEESAFLKTFSCSWGLDNQILQLLGVSHVLTPSISQRQMHVLFPKFVAEEVGTDEALGFTVFKVPDSGPHIATFVPHSGFGQFFDKIETYMRYVPQLSSHTGLARLEAGRPAIDPRWVLDDNGQAQRYQNELVDQTVSGCPDHADVFGSLPMQIAKDMIQLTIDTPCAGFLNIPFSFIPGWHAEVNGRPSKIYQFEQTTLGLKIETGRSDIKLFYRPRWIFLMLGVSFITLVLTIFWGLSGVLSSRQSKRMRLSS